jgi:phosphatidate cytidylyltransferase
LIRILSGVLLIALLVVTVWWLHPFATVALAAIIAVLGAAEVANLSQQVGAPVPARFVGPLAGVICTVFALGLTMGRPPVTEMLPVVLLAVIVAAGVATLAAGAPDASVVARGAVSLMAPIYVGLPLGAIARIRVTRGAAVVSVLALMVIASDSAQYFAGRAFGRRKLAPLISPSKTIEGAIGGLIAAAAIGATLGARWIDGVTPASGALLGALVAGFGMVGDLFESLLKRGAGVKDSSSLIPGHGGVLDRIDSWLFAGPVYYVFLRYLG